MKKAHQINFEGFEFFIDEDARLLFYEFIENSEKLFMKDEKLKTQWEAFKKELGSAIKEKIKSENKVMSIEELETIIDKISQKFSMKTEKSTTQDKSKLFRNLDSSVIGGVCSGLSNFTGIDVAWIRVLFILLIFTPVGIIGYLVLWIAIPPNRIREHTTNTTKPPKQKATQTTSEASNLVNTFFTGLGNLFRVIFNSIGVIIGIVFIFVGIFIILGFFNIWPLDFSPRFHFNHWNHDWNDYFYNINPVKLLFLLCFAFLIVIPIIALTINLIKSIFNVQGKSRVFRHSMRLLWFLCLLTLIGIWITSNDVSGNNTSRQSFDLETVNSDIIYIDMENISHPEMGTTGNELDLLKYGQLRKHGDYYMYGKPEIKITHSNISKANIIIRKEARINDDVKNKYKLYNIEYNWEQRDSLLILDRYFYSTELRWWNFPKITAEIVVPEFQNVVFTEPFVRN